MASLSSSLSSGDESDRSGSMSYGSGDDIDLDPPPRFGQFSEGSSVMPRRCACGLRTVVRTCWERDNPGRRFISCRLQKVSDDGCNLLRSVDPPFPAQARKVILELREKEVGLMQIRDELGKERYQLSLEVEKLEFDFHHAKGFAEFLSEIDVQQRKEIHDLVAEKKLMKKLLLLFGLLVLILVFVIMVRVIGVAFRYSIVALLLM